MRILDKEEEFYKGFLNRVGLLFKSCHFDDEQRKGIMAIILPSFFTKAIPDYEPILFEILQSDMEKIMFFLNAVIKCDHICPELKINISNIKADFQHKINKHIEYGEWK